MITLTQERLRELLNYDSLTGEFRWRVSRKGVKVGALAGSICKDGYRDICVDGRLYRAARLAFLYMTGSWPKYEADHENTIRSDDRWENLRDATPSQNKVNRRSWGKLGVKGVYPLPSGRYYARIKVADRTINLGTRDTIEEAAALYAKAANDRHGKFARLS